MKAGVVYMARVSGTDIYKIGSTAAGPQKRLKQIEDLEGVSLDFVTAVRVEDRFSVEKMMHRRLLERLHHGIEWFSLDGDEARETVEYLCQHGERVDYGFPPEANQKVKSLTIRVTEEQRATFSAEAEKVGLDVTAWARSMLLQATKASA